MKGSWVRYSGTHTHPSLHNVGTSMSPRFSPDWVSLPSSIPTSQISTGDYLSFGSMVGTAESYETNDISPKGGGGVFGKIVASSFLALYMANPFKKGIWSNEGDSSLITDFDKSELFVTRKIDRSFLLFSGFSWSDQMLDEPKYNFRKVV